MNCLARNTVFCAVTIALLACQLSRAEETKPESAVAQKGIEDLRSAQKADNGGGEKKRRVKSPFVLPGSVAMHKDIVYGRGGGRGLKADLFLPKYPPEDGPMPAMIYIHGGGWQSGKKDAFHRQAAHLASKGEDAIHGFFNYDPYFQETLPVMTKFVLERFGLAKPGRAEEPSIYRELPRE